MVGSGWRRIRGANNESLRGSFDNDDGGLRRQRGIPVLNSGHGDKLRRVGYLHLPARFAMRRNCHVHRTAPIDEVGVFQGAVRFHAVNKAHENRYGDEKYQTEKNTCTQGRENGESPLRRYKATPAKAEEEGDHCTHGDGTGSPIRRASRQIRIPVASEICKEGEDEADERENRGKPRNSAKDTACRYEVRHQLSRAQQIHDSTEDGSDGVHRDWNGENSTTVEEVESTRILHLQAHTAGARIERHGGK